MKQQQQQKTIAADYYFRNRSYGNNHKQHQPNNVVEMPAVTDWLFRLLLNIAIKLLLSKHSLD